MLSKPYHVEYSNNESVLIIIEKIILRFFIAIVAPHPCRYKSGVLKEAKPHNGAYTIKEHRKSPLNNGIFPFIP